MEKDNKKYLRAVLIIIITALCTMKLPHRDKSILQFIIPPIKPSSNSRIYLSGILPFFVLLWSYKEIVKSNYFNRKKSVIFILMFLFIIPMLFKAINIVKIPYYTLNTGLKTIEVVDSKTDFDYNGESNGRIKIELHLKNYSKDMKNFRISFRIPESLSTVISERSVILPDEYRIGPHEDNMYIRELIEFNYVDGYSDDDLFRTGYHYDDYKFTLFNQNQELVIIHNE